MNSSYVYALFYLAILIIATVATYFIHLPREFLIGAFGVVLGSGLPSVIPNLSTSPTSTQQIVRPL